MSQLRRHVHVIVDPRDDLGTVEAIYALQRQEQDVLVVPIQPTAKSGKAVAYEILRILDERESTRQRSTLYINWENVRRRLVTAGVCRLILLYAHNIEPTVTSEIADELAGTGLIAILVYLGWEARERSTFALEDLLAGRRPPQQSPDRTKAARWPAVPDVHPLRFRYDCRWKLSKVDFEQVDQELGKAFTIICRWIDVHPFALDQELAQALDAEIRDRDADLLTIRRCAAWLAMLAARRRTMTLEHGDWLQRDRQLLEVELPAWMRCLDLDGGWSQAHHKHGPPADVTWPYRTTRPRTLGEILHTIVFTTNTAISEKLADPGIDRGLAELVREGVLPHKDQRISATRLAMFSAYQTHEAPFVSPTRDGVKPFVIDETKPEPEEGLLPNG